MDRWAIALGDSNLKPMPGPAATRDMPGADPRVLRSISDHGMQPICALFDTAETDASERALRDILFSGGGDYYSGHRFMELVCSPRRSAISGLRLEPPKALHSLRTSGTRHIARSHRRRLALAPLMASACWMGMALV